MSTILKALRRLEHERSQSLRRPLREEVAGGDEPRRGSPIRWVAAGVFAAGLALGAGALFLWPGALPLGLERAGPDATEPVSSAAVAPPPAQPSPRPPEAVQARVPRGYGEGLPEEALSSEVEVVRNIAPTPLPVREEVAAAPPGERRGSVRPGAEALKPRPKPKPQARPEPAPVQVAAVKPEPAPPPPAPVVAAPKPEPTREPAVPVPVILVSRTQWHPHSERREALIEVEIGGETASRRVREGDAVGPLVVRTIEPSGVIFGYEEHEIRHAVGN